MRSPMPRREGLFASCKHLATLCFALEDLVRLKQSRDFATLLTGFKLGTSHGKENLNQDLCMKLTSVQRSMVKRMQETGKFFMTLDCLYTETLRKQTKTCSI